MSTQIEIIINEVEKFNQSIKDALDSKNITNTGEAARSLRIEYGEDYVRSLGIFYLEFLDTGRGSGKFPPKQPIEKWVETKLSIGQDDPQFDGIVFMIQRKIANLGTEIYRNNSKGIELEDKIKNLREYLNNEVRKDVTLTIEKKLDKFKQAFIKKNLQI